MTARTEDFRVEDGQLRRAVVPKRGQPYEHGCERETFVEVLHEIDRLGGAGFVYEQILDELDAPASQVATAVAFLRERGCVVPQFKRKHRAATGDVFLDGMTEFEALAAGEAQ